MRRKRSANMEQVFTRETQEEMLCLSTDNENNLIMIY